MNKELLASQRRAKDAFSGFRTVFGVGVGPKLTRGRVTASDAIVVLVGKKLRRADVPKGELIPPVFDGYPTDVRVPVLQVPPKSDEKEPPGDWCRTDAQWIDWAKVHELAVEQQRGSKPKPKPRRRRASDE